MTERGRPDPRRLERVVPQVPVDAVDPLVLRASHRSNDRLAFENIDGDVVGRDVLQVVVDGRAVRRIEPVGVGANAAHLLYAREPIGRARLEQVHVRVEDVVVELPDGCDVVEDSETTAVGADHEIAEVLLDGQPVHGCRGQVVAQARPGAAVVEAHVQGVLGAQVEKSLALRILPGSRARSSPRSSGSPR